MKTPSSNASSRLKELRHGSRASFATKRARSRAHARSLERIKAELAAVGGALPDLVANLISIQMARLAGYSMNEIDKLGASARYPNPGVPEAASSSISGSGFLEQDPTCVRHSTDDAFFPNPKTGFAPGARARAVLRGKEIAARDLIESGGSYSLEEVRKLLNGVSRQSIEKRVREGTMLAVQGPNNKRFYPVAQFRDDGAVVEGLQAVARALRTDNGFAILNFLVNRCSRLDNRKPIDLLRKGEVQLVVEAARRDGEQGA